MPKLIITQIVPDGPNSLGVNGFYAFNGDFRFVEVRSIPCDMTSPVKNQIDKGTIADYATNELKLQTALTVGDIEIIT